MSILLTAALLAVQEPDPGALVRDLSSPDVETRDAAAKKLVELGEPARGALKRAAEGPDAEAAGRAREALAELDRRRAERSEKRASELLERAVTDLREAARRTDGEERRETVERALESLRTVVREHPASKAYGMAHFNAGVVLCDYLGRYDDAIEEFAALIAGPANDRDPTGLLMSPYRNYRFHAWRMTSTCHRRRGRPGRALEALFRMRKVYVSHCGRCRAGMEKEFRKDARSLLAGLATEKEIEGLLEGSGSAPALLLKLGRSKAEGAAEALRILAEEFPDSPEAKRRGPE